MRKRNPTVKPPLNVDGKMNQHDCGKVGNTLATAAIVAASAPLVWALCKGLAALIVAIRWW